MSVNLHVGFLSEFRERFDESSLIEVTSPGTKEGMSTFSMTGHTNQNEWCVNLENES